MNKQTARFTPLAFIALLLSAVVPTRADDSALKENLITLEKQSWEAWKNRNAEFFKEFLSDDHVEVGFYGTADKKDVLATVATPACVVQSYSLDPIKVTLLDASTALLTYYAAQDTSCHDKPLPSPVWFSSLYLKRRDRWLNVFYQQTAMPK
ncbi:MAG: hypothetical protein QOD12_549 [Verrucomicrobiota bacterium]|jgi:hypothetical protein